MTMNGCLRRDNSFFCRFLKFGEIDIRIYQECVGDVGCVVWDSAIVACHYFARRRSFWKKKKVLELGAGTGVCSILLAALGADVNATDLPGRISLLEKNIQENSKAVAGNGGSVRAKVLNWNDLSEEPLVFDAVFMVDAIYYVEALGGLVRTLRRSEAKTIICCYEVRDTGEPQIAQKRFFEMLSPWFDVHPIADEELDPLYRSFDIKILHLLRK